MARFLLWVVLIVFLTFGGALWHGFCYALPRLALFVKCFTWNTHADTRNKMFHVEQNTKS